MGQTKQEIEQREQASHDAAERDRRQCPYCNATIPYGTDTGPGGECPSCSNTMTKDD